MDQWDKFETVAMNQTIKAEEKELRRIFSNDYLFEIPAYQRPYSWTTEQTSELLDDLRAAIEDGGDVEEISPYFLGSIVLIKSPTNALAQVVDGQQRLTTLTILFCVLRELSEDDYTRGSFNEYVCERGNQFAGSKDRFRLSLRELDREFFRRKVQTVDGLAAFLKQDKATLTDSRQRIFENAKYLWDQLEKLDQAARDRLAMFLVQRCYLVVVAASDQDSAYRIFSVMNDRGLDLSPTDILKADIIGAMPETNRADYTNRWEETEEDLGREGFKDLFAHIRMVYVKSKARRNLNKEFRDGVLEKVDGHEFFINEVLTPYAEAYHVVSRAAYESTNDADKVNSYPETSWAVGQL